MSEEGEGKGRQIKGKKKNFLRATLNPTFLTLMKARSQTAAELLDARKERLSTHTAPSHTPSAAPPLPPLPQQHQ